MDIARPLRTAGMPVCVGGFHVSGCMSMLGENAPELALAREFGVSDVRGRGRGGALDEVIATAILSDSSPSTTISPTCLDCRGAPAPILSTAGRGALDTQLVELRPRPRLPVRMFVLHDHQRAGPQEPASAPPRTSSASCAAITSTASRLFFVTDDNLARNRTGRPIATG